MNGEFYISFKKIGKTFVFAVVGFFLLGLSVLFFPQQSMAQSQVKIIRADSIRGGTFHGQRVRKILGNVYLKSENFEMRSDSAYQFINESEIRAYGDIQIDSEEEKIWADSLTYYTDVDFSQLRGRVIIETDSTTLFGNSVDYRFSSRIAHFIDKIRFEDQRGILLADSGYYYRQADSAVFRGHVQLADSMQYLEGDSLFSNRSTDYYEIYSNVYGNDRENNTMIQGDYLESDSTGRRLLKGNAWLKNFESDTTEAAPSDTTKFTPTNTTTSIPPDSTKAIPADTTKSIPPDTTEAQSDTTHIRAKTILSVEERSPTDTTDIVHGHGDVRIWSPSFSAVADTSRYSDRTDTFELWSNAKSWHKQVQLTGPYIQAQIENGDIDSLKSYPRPFSVQQDTVIDRLNQITGDTLHADFEEGALNEIYVFGNSHLLRFTKNDQGQPDGAIDLTAPNIRIFFEEGELIEMKAIGSVNGSYLPETEKTAKRRLDGFVWNPKMRPREPEEQMQRRFPEIPKEVFFELPWRYVEHLEENHPESKKIDIERR